MSLDLVVWLSCSISLTQDLPYQPEWHYYKLSVASLPGIPKAFAAEFGDHEFWQIDRDIYLIKASRVEVPKELEGQGYASLLERQRELARRSLGSKLGVSLIVEGNYEAGYKEQAAIANYFARKCKGAIVEGPAGYFAVDEGGNWE